MGTKPTTQVDYKYILSRHLCPAFEHALVSEITTEDIQVFLNSKMEIARSTVNKIMIALDQIFRSAVKDKIITESPVDHERIYNPSKKVQTREALTEDQLRDILNHLHLLNWQDRRMLALLAFTGMRRGEVLGLRWEDIDLKNEVIHVRRNITYPLNAPYVDTPKTKAGIRDIPLDIRLLNHLMPVQATGYVIGGTMPITKSSYIKAMMRIKKRLDLHGATAHIFRHTYATILNSAGVDPKTIQYILGHSDIATTMNRYTHVSQSNLKEAVVKFQHRV